MRQDTHPPHACTESTDVFCTGRQAVHHPSSRRPLGPRPPTFSAMVAFPSPLRGSLICLYQPQRPRNAAYFAAGPNGLRHLFHTHVPRALSPVVSCKSLWEAGCISTRSVVRDRHPQGFAAARSMRTQDVAQHFKVTLVSQRCANASIVIAPNFPLHGCSSAREHHGQSEPEP
ncbi:hypothetical protein P171DRAFT_182359 [Karstenula rhodostoma CBS 690.94]|uniref:Uncharacterized protein n=1 Tax=Karstenula rhodostoma CBS 690.94 TaxID=1392251 RepID=A0A9P4P6E5_9PLEO|nr:hypothetical protein P171DRAFT_182359 [Karstenula rhodostoma CBS 690.94]